MVKRKKNKNHKNRGAESGKSKTLADAADKFLCYQKSVQTPDHEVDFFEQAFKDSFGRKPYSLREDFCGTFAVCCSWVESNRRRTATGIDLCPETLQWGKDNNLSKLTDSQKRRVKILERDVRTNGDSRVDVLAAQNFSFWIFKSREEVVEYFRIARENINDEGIMVMDMMGGGACYEEGTVDSRKIGKGKKRFKYQWEQHCFNPVTADASFFIHFEFQDGSRLDRAFEYHWRFWTIPEVREMLSEAGYSESHLYWEQEDEDGEETSEWARGDDAVSHPSWICYLVAVR